MSDTESVGSVEETQRLIASQINALPEPVQRSFIGLAAIQKEKDELLKAKEAEMLAIEQKYHEKSIPLVDSMNKIINAQQDVADEVVVQYGEQYGSHQKEENLKVSVDDLEVAKPKIPNFWLTAMKHNEVIKSNIHEPDEPALRYLLEVNSLLAFDSDFKAAEGGDTEVAADESTDQEKQESKEAGKGKPIEGFKLVFVFEANPFFKNDILTKAYKIENNNIIDAKGTEIDWFEGKCLTEKKTKKKQKNKKTGKQREIVKTEELESFFNMFKDTKPLSKKDKETMDQDKQDELQEKLDEQCDVATEIHEILLNSPVEYFFGVTDDGDQDPDFEDMDDDDEDMVQAMMGAAPGGGKKKKNKKKDKKGTEEEGGEDEEGDQKKCANQ